MWIFTCIRDLPAFAPASLATMSRHPIEQGGYRLSDYGGDVDQLIQAHRANVNPEYVGTPLSEIREAHNARRYQDNSWRGPSFQSTVDKHKASCAPDSNLNAAAVQALFQHEGDAGALSARIVAGDFTVVDVTEAALYRTKIAAEVLGCCSEIPQTVALQRARELDQLLAGTVHDASARDRLLERMPLFGVPISIKGHVGMAGTTSSRGFVIDALSPDSVASLPSTKNTLAANPHTVPPPTELIATVGVYVPAESAPIVTALLHAGAVVVAKTTMPQTVMHLDTRSALYGQALNPYNLSLSPGGSSGGESALLAARGASLLGLGTDIGGSIRQPAAVSGLWGFRPSCYRLPMSGYRNSSPGNPGVGAATGPLAHSLRDIRLFMQTLLRRGRSTGRAACGTSITRSAQSRGESPQQRRMDRKRRAPSAGSSSSASCWMTASCDRQRRSGARCGSSSTSCGKRARR